MSNIGRFFEDDLEIKRFLETVDEFSYFHIDLDQDSEEGLHADVFLNKNFDHHIVQFPSIPLERLFDGNDVVVKDKCLTENVDVTE
jgi:hypothetical protein